MLFYQSKIFGPVTIAKTIELTTQPTTCRRFEEEEEENFGVAFEMNAHVLVHLNYIAVLHTLPIFISISPLLSMLFH